MGGTCDFHNGGCCTFSAPVVGVPAEVAQDSILSDNLGTGAKGGCGAAVRGRGLI